MVFFNTIEELDANVEYNNIAADLCADIAHNLACISKVIKPCLTVDIEYNSDAKCVRVWLKEIHQAMEMIKKYCSDSVFYQLQKEIEMLVNIKYNTETPIVLMTTGKWIVKYLLAHNYYDEPELDKFDMDNEILDSNIEIIQNNCCYTNEFVNDLINEFKKRNPDNVIAHQE